MTIATRSLLAAFALVTSLPGIAWAEDVITTSVSVRRIAVDTPSAARTLERRLEAAALRACGAEDHEPFGRRETRLRSTCYANALSAAQLQAGISNSTTTATTKPMAMVTRP